MAIPHETDVLIVGGGPAGLSAARTCEEYGLRYLLVEEKVLGGQLRWTHNAIHDYVGVSGVSGPSFLEKMVSPEDNLIFRAPCLVQQLEVETSTATLVAPESGEPGCAGSAGGVTPPTGTGNSQIWKVRFKGVVLATGSSPRKLGVPGEELEQVHGPYFSTTEHAASLAGKSVVVIGGGDRALEGAIRCAEAGASVTIVHRSNDFRAKAEFVREASSHPRIQFQLQTRIERIVQREFHQLDSQLEIYLNSQETGERRTFVCDVVLIRIGVEPKVGLVRGIVQCSAEGFVEVDRFGRTSQRAIYAAGDVCVPVWAARLQAAIASGSTAIRTMMHDGIV